MKKALMILGGVFLSILSLAGIIFIYLAVSGARLDKESYNYVKDTVPILCTSLNYDTYVKYSSDDLKKIISPEGVMKLSSFIEKLGKFGRIVSIEGESNVNLINLDKTAKYSVGVEFEFGNATIEIALTKMNDVWKYNKFHKNVTGMRKKPNEIQGGAL